MVTVMILGQTLQQMVKEPELEVEVNGPATVQGLLEANAEKMGGVIDLLRRGEVLITLNRKVGALDSAVRDGDTIKLTHNFNPIYEGATWHNP